MASRSLDVLEDRSDPGVLSVAEHVHVELDRILEKPVDETGAVDCQLGAAAGDVDAAPADHMVRADEHGVAELVGTVPRFRGTGGGAPRRRVQA